MANPDTDGLKIGDLICLKSPKWESFLAAEGILLDDLVVSDNLQSFDDCLFAVHLQRQYSASRELESFLEAYGVDADGMKKVESDEAMKQYKKALEKGRDNEVRLNDAYMKNKVGQPVNFGDVIQLFHAKSKKYLVINPKQLANGERENSRASLIESGNIYSGIQFMPRFKIDREGDRILSGSEAYIRIAERTNEFIHAADKTPKVGFEKEVNCSLEQTSWALTIFQSCIDAMDSSVALASKLVYIHDPETRSNLTVGKVDDDDEEENVEMQPTEGNGGFFHQFGDIHSIPMGEVLDLRCIWSLETKAIITGGPIQWKTDQVRLKHVASNLFLTMLRNPLDDNDEVIFTVTSNINDPGTLFFVSEVNSLRNFLSMSKALQITQEGQYLQRGDELRDKKFAYKGTRVKDDAVSLLINEYVQFAPSSEEEGEREKDPLDVNSALSIRKYFEKYYNMIIIPRNRNVKTLWPNADTTEMQNFDNLVTKAKNFSAGFNISEENITLGVDKSNQQLRLQRQLSLNELGVVEVVMKIIEKLVPITEMIENSLKYNVDLHDSEIKLQQMGNSILQSCLDFTYYCILDCPENQMYVADSLPVLLGHLSTQPLAGQCVTTMLSTNMELQETKMGDREVAIFVDKLKKSNFNSMYLNLLQSCCSCQGQGVDANQCRVAETLFDDPDGILVELCGNHEKLSTMNWNQASSIYIGNNTEKKPIQAYSLIEDGIPELSLRWTSTKEGYSAKELFGTDVVKLEDVFPIDLDFDDKDELNQKRNTVANYFINEMYLGAEMCMDRNYVAMHKLDDLFPYEALVTIMKMNVHNFVKASACRLLFCLHIDRDPQASTKIPCLTRTWDEVEQNKVPQLPYVEVHRRNVYALVQQMCSEHVVGMVGKSWDVLSKSILQILLAMIKFNFYGTIEKLQDVIGPLVNALDRRNVAYDDTVVQKTDDDADEEGTPDTWQKRHYEVLESLPFMLGILFLVLLAVGITIWQVVADAEETTELFIFGLIVLAIFVYDFFMRLYCYWHTYGNIPKFLCDTFNIIDQVVILIDVVFLALPSDIGGSNANFSKTLRLIRLVRLVRVLRAAKVINALVKKKDDVIRYKAPARYTKTPMFELETMTEAINVLVFVQGVIDDRNLSILLRYFHAWYTEEDTRSPAELFEQVCEESAELSLDINDFNGIMADALMFYHIPLVQGAMNVLMAHHSSRETLLANAKQAQMLVAPVRQKQFVLIRGYTSKLEQNAETHELWGELETEEDRELNKETKMILRELINTVRVGRYTLEFGEDFQAVKEIQDLLRNLGLFDISQKVLGLMDSVEEDEETGELGEVARNTQEIGLMCNELLYWCIIGNDANQAIMYDQLRFFLDTLDDGIKSHKIIAAIFKGNETLMKLVPHSYLDEMADKIVNDGKSHHYLALSKAITHVGEKNIPKNQFEIIRTLCNPDRLEQTSVFICPVEDEEYMEKRQLMVPFKDGRDTDIDTLPPLLAYHLTFLEVLSCCTSGKINISNVEAKVQSIFPLKDIIEAILEPDTILICKIRLADYLLNAIIDVEMALPGLCESRHMWNLIESFIPVLSFAKDEIRAVEKMGWEVQEVSRHRIEYIMLAIQNIGAFFSKNYDASKMRNEDGTTNPDRVSLSMSRVNDIILTLYNSIFELYDLDTPRLAFEAKANMYDALVALNQSATNVIVTYIDPIHLETEGAEEEEKDPDEKHEEEVLAKYDEFCKALEESEEVQESIGQEINGFIDIYENLDSTLNRASKADLRYEPFIQKLVTHVRENTTTTDGIKDMNAECTATTTWMIKSFRTQIENKMEMSIYDRDDDGGDEEDEKSGPYIQLLNENGVTGLCIDLIAPGIDETLQSEVIKLLVGMLFKEGGAREVQGSMNAYLTKNNTELFFTQVRNTLQKLIAWHQWNEVIILEEDEDPEPPEDILIVRMLQLMSEGHYLPNQDIMREQPANLTQVNLLDDFVNYLNTLSRIPCQTSTDAAIRVGATIVEVIQGPCTENQKYFALNTELLEIINRVMRAKAVNDCKEDQEIEMKKTCTDTISALLEGQMPKDPITVRILSVIHVDIFQTLAAPFVPEAPEDDEEEEAEGPDEDQMSLQAECVVLLQMLCDYKPSIRKDMQEDGIELDASSVACVEISWDGVLNRRFFHVPDVCYLLAKSSKDHLVQEVDRSNPENKLLDFLDRASNLYREIKHQEYLTEMGVAKIFSPGVHNTTTWVSFFISLVINALFAAYYKINDNDEARPPTDDQDDEYSSVLDFNENPFYTDPTNVSIPDNIRTVVSVLNYLQLTTSLFTIILTLVVRSPVIAWGLSEDPDITSNWQIALYTALDPMTLYYCWYFLFACLGAFYHDMFITFLLLDLIVKNPTTADILNSVVLPRKQLMVAFILGAFTIYIYTFFIFFFMPYRLQSDDDGTPGGSDAMDCQTLWGCYKYVFGYGFRQGGGIGDIMYHDIGWPMMLHYTFFLVVTVAMLNIIFGIIIDTFSGLRSEKNERTYNTTETCFICSVHRQVFDRAANSPDGFKNHIRNDHNMWNYLNFIFFLWEQDKDDDDGLEYYVRHKIIANEITWIPMHKAMCLDLGETDMEVMRGEVFATISEVEKSLLEKVGELQIETDVYMNRLSKAIEQDYSNATSIKVGLSEFMAKATKANNDIEGLSVDMSEVSIGGADENASLSSMNRVPTQLNIHIDSVNLPHIDNEEELLNHLLVIRNHYGTLDEASASKADMESHTAYYAPQNIKVLDDIYSEQSPETKRVEVQVMQTQPNSRAHLFLASIEFFGSDLVNLADYEQLEKPFKVNDSDCMLRVTVHRLEEGAESIATGRDSRSGRRKTRSRHRSRGEVDEKKE